MIWVESGFNSTSATSRSRDNAFSGIGCVTKTFAAIASCGNPTTSGLEREEKKIDNDRGDDLSVVSAKRDVNCLLLQLRRLYGDSQHIEFRFGRHRLATAHQLGAAQEIPLESRSRGDEKRRIRRDVGDVR